MRFFISNKTAVFTLLISASLNATPHDPAKQNPYAVLGFDRAQGIPSADEIAKARRVALKKFHPDVETPVGDDAQAGHRNLKAEDWAGNIEAASESLKQELDQSEGTFASQDPDWWSALFEAFYDNQRQTSREAQPPKVTPDPARAARDRDVAVNGFGNPGKWSSYGGVEMASEVRRYAMIRTALKIHVMDRNRMSIESALGDTAPWLRMHFLSELRIGLYQEEYMLAMLYDFWHRYSQQIIEIKVFSPSGKAELLRGRLVDLHENGDYLDPFIVLRLPGTTQEWDRHIPVRFIHLGDFALRFGFLSRALGDFTRENKHRIVPRQERSLLQRGDRTCELAGAA